MWLVSGVVSWTWSVWWKNLWYDPCRHREAQPDQQHGRSGAAEEPADASSPSFCGVRGASRRRSATRSPRGPGTRAAACVDHRGAREREVLLAGQAADSTKKNRHSWRQQRPPSSRRAPTTACRTRCRRQRRSPAEGPVEIAAKATYHGRGRRSSQPLHERRCRTSTWRPKISTPSLLYRYPDRSRDRPHGRWVVPVVLLHLVRASR